MQITVRTQGEVAVLELRGRFDFHHHREFRKATQQQLEEGRRYLFVDLEGVGFVDSSALGMILLTHEQARLRGGSVALLKPREYVLKVLDLVQFHRILPICESEQEAMELVARGGLVGAGGRMGAD